MANLKAANDLQLGLTQVQKAYFGSNQVWPVETGGGWSETEITLDGSQYIDLPSLLPSDTRNWLAFVSFSVSATNRQALLSWNGASGGIHAVFSGNLLRSRELNDTGGDPTTSFGGAYTINTRYHGIIAGRASGAAIELKSRVILGDGTRNASTAGSSGSTSVLVGAASKATRVGAITTNNHYLNGKMYRIAMWTDAGSNFLLDVDSDTAVDNFVTSGGALVDPATSHTAYGTPQFDFNGSLADWNAGIHTGSQGAGTVTGTFT